MSIYNFFYNNLHNFFGKYFQDAMLTGTLFILFVLMYSILAAWVKSRPWGIDKKRRHTTSSRNTLVLIFAISLIFIWSGEIKTMILSITALAAAIIIAFKEMILCFLGSFFITSNKLFALGEYIEIDGIKGKVIDKNFIYTKLLLSETFQTREMNIPNIVFVTNKVVNLSHYGKFQAYILKIAVPEIHQVKRYSEILSNLAHQTLSEYEKKYDEYFKAKQLNDIFFDVPKNHYIIEHDISDVRNVTLKLHYLAHPLDQENIELKIIQGYTDKLHEDFISIQEKQNFFNAHTSTEKATS